MKGIRKYVVIAAILIGIFAVIGFIQLRSPRTLGTGGQACPADAMLCPDGSAVGRTGPNCSFAPCPTSATSSPSMPVTDSATTTLAIGDKVIVNGMIISPLKVLEDSRCATDVTCIQAGTVRVSLSTSNPDEDDVSLALGQPQLLAGMTVTLISVTPAKQAKVLIAPSDYRFTLTIVPQ